MENQFIDDLREDLIRVSRADDAIQMAAYMKNKFVFIGVKSPDRKRLGSIHINKWLKCSEGLDVSLLRQLWAQPEREIHYIAMEYAARTKRYWTSSELDEFEYLVLQNSWWDTVDFIATNLIGALLLKFPDKRPVMNLWNQSDNLWKIRCSIIYQLKYKALVDFDQMKQFILAHADSREFFLKKASGWALRQHAKLAPEQVIDFVDKHDLSALTKREALKRVVRAGNQ